MGMTLKDLVQSPYFTLGLALLAVLSIVLTVIFFRKSQRRKRPVYSITRRTVIENTTPIIPGLSVHFNGEEQTRVTVVHIWFWNLGAETIRATDVANASPLGIEIAKGATLLSAHILRITDPANQFELGKPDTKEDGAVFIPLHFDYFDKQDGVVVQIVHNAEENHHIYLRGKIMGVAAVEKVYSIQAEDGRQKVHTMGEKYPRFMGVSSIVIFVNIGLICGFEALTNKEWILLVVAIASFLAAASCYPIYLRGVLPKRLVLGIENAQKSLERDGKPQPGR